MADHTVAADTAAPQKTSRWEDYIDVFFSPAELFRRRAADRVAPPLLTLLFLSIVVYFLLLPANRMIMQAGIAAANPQVLEQMNGPAGTIMAIFGGITQPIMYFIFVVITAFLLWITGRFADVRIDFSRAMLIATYGSFIYLLSQILLLVLIMIQGEGSIDMVRSMSWGPLRFMGDADMNKALLAFLSRIDVFAFWQAIVWAIGVRVIYNVSTLRAGIIAAVVWLLQAVPALLAFAAGGAAPQA